MADLHLGRKLLGEPLWKEQQKILEQIVEMADQEKPDAVLICGDVYDKSIPSQEAVQLLDYFLDNLSKRRIQVFLISGNHDNAQRLEFAGGILAREGIHIAGIYRGGPKEVALQDEYGPIHVWMLPFLRPGMMKPFEEKIPETYHEAVKTAVAYAHINMEERNVLMSHQFVTFGGEKPGTSDSEQLSLGGIDQVDASCFDGFDYVALGHIHRPQKIGGLHVRYAGSPLKYSFSEWEQKKAVTVVQMGAKGDISIRKLPLIPATDMAVLRDTMENFMSDKYASYRKGWYLSIRLTDEGVLENPMERLQRIFPGMLEFAIENRRTSHVGLVGGAGEECLEMSPEELFLEFYEKQNGIPMNQTEREILREVLESMEGERI